MILTNEKLTDKDIRAIRHLVKRKILKIELANPKDGSEE